MFKVKFLLIISAILILVYENSNSQMITFSARNTKNNEIIKLDSVKVMNLTQKKDTVLKGNFALDLSVFTTVENNALRNSIPFSVSQNYPNSFENDTRFSVNLPEASDLNILVRNILGEQVCSFNQYFSPGFYTFQLNGSGLTGGIYLISASVSDKTKVIKAIKIGNSNNSTASLDYISNDIPTTTFAFLPGDKFDFIGYSRNKVDTLSNQIPKGGENYEFGIEFLSPWLFSSGRVEIGGIFVINEHHYESSAFPDTLIKQNWLDTTELNYVFKLQFCQLIPDYRYSKFNCWRCNPIENIDNTIKFCCEQLEIQNIYLDKYKITCNVLSSVIEIDSVNNKISLLDLYNSNQVNNDYPMGIDNYTNKVKLKDLVYTKTTDNKILCTLIGKDVLQKIINLDNYVNNWTKDGAGKDDYTSKIISIYTVPDSAYIKIGLYP